MEPVHLTFASTSRHPLFPDETRRREALHVIGRVAAGRVVLFAIVDDHVHLVLLCDRAAAGVYARALLLALRCVAAVELAAAHISEVRGRAHLERLVRYLLEQPAHHGLSVHPALWTGSCFPDLVGARSVPGLGLRLATALPRYRLRDAYAIVGLPTAKLEPASDQTVRDVGAARVIASAAAAAGASPVLSGRHPSNVAARRAAVALAGHAKLHPAEVASALGVTRDAVQRILRRPEPTELVAATRLHLALGSVTATAATTAAVTQLAATQRR